MSLKFDLIGRFIGNHKINPIVVAAIVFLIIGLGEHLIVPKIAHYSIHQDFKWYVELFSAFIVTPFYYWFYIWGTYSIKHLGEKLLRNGVITIGKRKVINDWYQSLHNNLGKWEINLLAILLLLYSTISLIYGWLFDIPPWFGRNNTIHFIFASITSTLQWYLIVCILLREVVFAIMIRKLFNENPSVFRVRYGYSDRAGGYGDIGTRIMWLVILIIVIGSFHLAKTIETYKYTGLSNVYGFGQLFSWVIYIVSVPFVSIYALLPCHKVMKNFKDKIINSISEKIDNQLLGFQKHSTDDISSQNGNLNYIKSLQIIQENVNKDIATWPLRAAIPRLTIASLWPLFTWIISVIFQRII